MCWELASVGVLEKDVDLQCPKTRRAWERKKLEMEKASRWTGARTECIPSTNHLREKTLKEVLEIVVQIRYSDKLMSIQKQCSPTH